ncbi:ABC transporter permease [Ruania alkalisoli]|uniref:ABC transporter permease n=1 Tax=Ruania alkalisoli TaxID=2779775 RepID=A0A7M1SPP6_9MICO|nr:ABC transporter permease [Ruania alkalisoli]QOR69421.1 ABC transporter permease [Ruania alkalisoli]
MNGLLIAVEVEFRKAVASRVLGATTIILVLGLVALTVGLELGVRSGNANVTAQLGPLAARDGWDRMFGLAAQLTAAGALIAFGVVLSWLVGREFADGTITSMFALPVARPAIMLAKFVVHLAWVFAVALVFAAILAVVGVTLGHGMPRAPELASLGRQVLLTVLTGLVAFPAAWAATLGRGLLPGIAATIGLVVCGQVMAIAGVGAWFPVAAPALWALDPSAVTGPQLALVGALAGIAAALTVRSWSRLQLDR